VFKSCDNGGDFVGVSRKSLDSSTQYQEVSKM